MRAASRHLLAARPVTRRPVPAALILLLLTLGAIPATADEIPPPQGATEPTAASATSPEPAVAPAETTGTTVQQLLGRVGKGFTFTTSDDRFSLNLAAAIQLRYTYVDYDESIRGNEEDYSNFYMRRARVWFSGHAYDPRITYLIHVQLEPNSDVNTHDIWLAYELHKLFKVGMGRNKIAYGLEFLNSGFGLALVERSVMYGETDIDTGGGGPVYPGGGTARFGLHAEADTGFATGGLCLYRSQGIQVEGSQGGEQRPSFEYQAGIWQGRRTRGTSNHSNNHLLALRVGFYPLGRINWQQQGAGDGGSDHYRVGLLVSAYRQKAEKGGGFTEQGQNLAMLHRFRGFSADLEWGVERFDYDQLSEDLERQGWRLQVGQALRPGRLELVARVAGIERLRHPTLATAMASGLGVARVWNGEIWITGIERKISEQTIGFNLFLNDWHRHKIQLDLSRLTRSFAADPAAGIGQAPDQHDLRFRAMIQLKI